MQLTVDDDAIRGVLHLPDNAPDNGIVLTHGAGSNHNAPLLIALAEAFAAARFAALRCDLPFRQKRPHGPPPRGSAETDQQGLRDAVAYVRTKISGRVYLGGHSYGGRQASMLAASQPDIADALLLLSYPLHPPKAPTQMRTAHFHGLQTAALFVHGARDGFATEAELRTAAKLIPAKTEILEVSSAGHELLSKRNATDLPSAIVSEFQRFI